MKTYDNISSGTFKYHENSRREFFKKGIALGTLTSVAGLCFILPAVIITGIFAVLYKEYGQLPQLQPFIYGIKPGIIAIILAAIYPLAKKSLKTPFLIGEQL